VSKASEPAWHGMRTGRRECRRTCGLGRRTGQHEQVPGGPSATGESSGPSAPPARAACACRVCVQRECQSALARERGRPLRRTRCHAPPHGFSLYDKVTRSAGNRQACVSLPRAMTRRPCACVYVGALAGERVLRVLREGARNNRSWNRIMLTASDTWKPPRPRCARPSGPSPMSCSVITSTSTSTPRSKTRTRRALLAFLPSQVVAQSARGDVAHLLHPRPPKHAA
jgi:hypothetical protein